MVAINSVFKLNVFTLIIVKEGNYHYLLGWMNKNMRLFANLCTSSTWQLVHHNTAHLDQSSSCLLLTQTASAHLLAAVQPIISLPPFLCSRSSLGHALGRKRGGREERRRGRGGLLSSDIVIKESPPPGLGPPTPTYSHTVWLPDTLPYTLLSAQSKEKQTHERDEEWETQRDTERGGERRDDNCEVRLKRVAPESMRKVKLGERKGVKTVVSGRSAWRRPRLRSWLLLCFTVLWLYDTALYFFFFFFCLELLVSHREALHTPATCWSGQTFTRSDSMCPCCSNVL